MMNVLRSFSPVVVIAGICVLILGMLVAGVAMRVIWENDILHIRSRLTGKRRRRHRRAPSFSEIDLPPK